MFKSISHIGKIIFMRRLFLTFFDNFFIFSKWFFSFFHSKLFSCRSRRLCLRRFLHFFKFCQGFFVPSSACDCYIEAFLGRPVSILLRPDSTQTFPACFCCRIWSNLEMLVDRLDAIRILTPPRPRGEARVVPWTFSFSTSPRSVMGLFAGDRRPADNFLPLPLPRGGSIAQAEEWARARGSSYSS